MRWLEKRLLPMQKKGIPQGGMESLGVKREGAIMRQRLRSRYEQFSKITN